MTQKNGLSDIAKSVRTIETHNFADSATWTDPANSAWTLEAPEGLVYRVQDCVASVSEDLDLGKANALKMEFFKHESETPTRRQAFKSMFDLFETVGDKQRIDLKTNDDIDPFWALGVPLMREVFLWHNTDFKKFKTLEVFIKNDTPYKRTSDPSESAQIMQLRFYVEVYDEPVAS